MTALPYTFSCPALDMHVSAHTAEQLVRYVLDEFDVLWRNFALAHDSELTPAAQELKTFLLSLYQNGGLKRADFTVTAPGGFEYVGGMEALSRLAQHAALHVSDEGVDRG